MLNTKIYCCPECFNQFEKFSKEILCLKCNTLIKTLKFDSKKEFEIFMNLKRVGTWKGKKIKSIEHHVRFKLFPSIYATFESKFQAIYAEKRRDRRDILISPSRSYTADIIITLENDEEIVIDVKPWDRKEKKYRTDTRFRRNKMFMKEIYKLEVIEM